MTTREFYDSIGADQRRFRNADPLEQQNEI